MKTLRLKAHEMEQVRKKSLEINKLLLDSGQPPIMDSKLIHRAISQAIPRMKLNEYGDVVLDLPR